MNSLFYKLKSAVTRGSKKKRMLLSIVILAEVIALLVVATYAWVETVSSIKITNETNTKGEIDTYVFTEAMIGAEQGTIDIAKYFKQSGDMHLAPASSADGRTLYFPKANISSNFIYRKGNVSDKNTAYMSVSFKIRTDANADFFFEQEPTFSALGDYIRVSVTSQSEGSTDDPVTTIYSNNASTTAVVNSTSGATGATTVEKYEDHIKGKSSTARLFAVGANETKIVTINIWLQKRTDANTDLTSNMSQAVTINNFGITSSLTPRHVTLLPTPTWDNSSATFYAWCFDARNGDGSRLYKLTLDENEHYSFNYNGTYQKTTFVRAVPDCTVQPGQYSSWPFSNNTASGTDGYWNQTVDTTIPNDPVDPTYIIETMSSGSNSKSTGSWHDPAIIKVAYTGDQSDSWGTMSATSYVGDTISTHVIESTNSSSQKHKDTVHAWPGKIIQLDATAKTNYAFVGWYDNEACTGNALSTSATYTPNAPSTATEITYYAKFKEVRKLTINRTVDGNSSSTAAAGTITIGGTTSSNTATSYSKTVDKGSSVSFSATAATGYTFDGFYTTATGDSTVTSPRTINADTTYFARFTTNSYNVTARAYYSNDYGSTYTANDSTGGTVKAGSTEAGATSTASVKYKNTVSLVASPASGYEFVGWFSVSSGGSALSTSTTYTYTLNTADAVSVYARFNKIPWQLKGSFDSWGGTTMSKESDNVYSVTVDLAEGDNTYKVYNTSQSGDSAWYGAANANDYKYGFGSNGDNTSFTALSNYSLNNNPGQDAHFVTHAGKYKFTFNSSNKTISISFVSYNNITITFDTSSTQWVGNSSAIVWFDSAQGSKQMTKNSNSNWTVSVPSNYATGISFKRNNSGNTETWNKWENNPKRGYSSTYKTSGDGTGDWQ